MAGIADDEAAIALYRDMYAGEHNVKLTTRQEEYLSADTTSFGNICKRVVGIMADRLRVAEDGIKPTDDSGQAYAEQARLWWTDTTDPDADNDIDAYSLQHELYTAALRDGATALVVGWDEVTRRPTFTPNALYDGATGLIRFHYDSDGKLLFASKRWQVWNPLQTGETGKTRLTVYAPDYIERYEASNSAASGWRLLGPEELGGVPNPQPWTDTQGQPLGIPVIPFDAPSGSALADVVTIQEMLNHNLATYDITVDYHGFPIIFTVNGDYPIDSATGQSQLPDFQPGTAINLGEGGSAGRIETADLEKVFNGGVMNWVQMIALVKGWPMWLFDKSQQPPSGVALQQMESSLVAQIQTLQAAFSGSWRKAFNLARKLHRLNTGQDLGGQIAFDWQPAQTIDQLADMQRLQLEFDAGQYPTVTRWRRMGNSEEEIAQMLDDKRREDDLGLADLTTGISQ